MGMLFLLLGVPVLSHAFDVRYEGRFRTLSLVLFDPPQNLGKVEGEVELRNGLVGNLWEQDEYVLDYEVIGDLLYVGGPREQAGLAEEYDAELFRGWVRLEKGDFKIRGGRQPILFGAGFLFRPLGLFDTRIISGVVPLTRGVDGVRATYFTSDTSLVEGWSIPAQQYGRALWGVRGERQFGVVEAGAIAQYHPATDLNFLPSFNLELLQLGYHLKGERVIGFWNESRLDIQQNRPGNPLRLDTVVGMDYTFNLGQGLHVLVEYFVRAQETGFGEVDFKGDRLLQNLGLLLDQPVDIDIVWRFFAFMDVEDRSFQIAPQIEYNIFGQVFLYFQAQVGGRIDGDGTPGRLFRGGAPVFTGTESKAGLTLIAYF